MLAASALFSIKITGGIYAGQPSGSGSVANDGMLTVDGSVGTATIGTIQGNADHAALFSVSGVTGNSSAVKTLTITRGVSFGSILAGYGSHTTNVALPTVANVGFGSITIGGNFTASFITAGADPGSDGIPGNSDDLISSSSATIGGVKIAGQFNGLAGSATPYKILAGVIDKLQVGSATYGHAALEIPGVPFNAIGQAEAICIA